MPERAYGVDLFRFLAAFGVIMLHALPSPISNESPAWSSLIAIPCRACVPFFFVTSGYFLVRNGTLSLMAGIKAVRRLIVIYVFWLIAYYTFFHFYFDRKVNFNLKSLVNGGEAFHLWFLPALSAGIVVVIAGKLALGSRVTGLICGAIYACALIRGPYHDFFGISGEPGRSGILVAPIYVLAGAFIRLKHISFRPIVCVAIAFTSLVACYIEEAFIAYFTAQPKLLSHDFLLSTVFLGVSTFMLGRSLSNNIVPSIAMKLGALSLGIYLTHLFFVIVLLYMVRSQSVSSVIATVILSALGAAVLTMLLRRISFLNSIIS